MLLNLTLDTLKSNKKLREEGKDITIPFPFPRFSQYIPGIQKRRYYIVTANSKVGKTKLADFLFVYTPLLYTKTNKTNIKIKILYFSLEMSKEDKVRELISHLLYIRKNIKISADLMDSVYKHYILENDVLEAIEEIKPEVEDFLQHIVFYDNIRNPFGIYKAVREYAHTHGHYEDTDGNILNTEYIEKGTNDEAKKIFRYVPDDPDEFVIVITDHVSLLTPEKGGTLHDAIGNFSSQYCLHIRDRWDYIVVNVQQQAAAQEGVDNYQNNMLRPSANGLGDNKLTGRDCDFLIGLFAPIRFRKETWEGYNIKIMKDSFREISLILNRRGSPAISGLYFDGVTNYFLELPPAEEMDNDKYDKLLKFKDNGLRGIKK